MKKFEQLKRWEVEACREGSREDLMKIWAIWGTKSYLDSKANISYWVGWHWIKTLRITYMHIIPPTRMIAKCYRGVSSSRRWWVEAGTDSKAYSTLREAYNAARKYILAGVTGDPKNFINQ